MAGYIFALAAALVLPVAAAVIMSRRVGTARPVLLGALTFFVFQGLLRIPLLQVVLPLWDRYVLFQFTRPVAFLVFLSLSAGIFEEVGRYLVMKRFMPKAPVSHGLAFGIGHGGIEAVLLVGINLLALALTQAVPIGPLSGQFFAAGLERITAMTFHVCLSVLVWRSLAEERPVLLPWAILLHTLLNVLAGYLSYLKVSTALIEGSLALGTLFFLIYTVRFLQRNNKTDG